jgi:hypothetical protein
MKLQLTVLVSIVFATVVFASLSIPYDRAKPPSLLLPDAYQRAATALGVDANRFHCISANITTDFSAGGGWMFAFCSTNSRMKWVTVDFTGKIHMEDFLAR